MQLRSRAMPLFVGVAFALALSPAWAQSNVVLENLSVKNDKSTIVIKRAEFVGANLSKDEATKLMTSASKEEAGELLGKLEAKQILIPEAVVTGEKDSIFTLRDFQATDIARGKIARLSLAGVDGAGKDDKGGAVTLKAGAITMDNLEVGGLIAALKGGDPAASASKATRIASNGFELTATDKDTPADAAGGNLIKIKLASMGIEQAYDADLPTRGVLSLNGLSIEFPKASKAGAQLAAAGYDSVQASLRFSAAYDPARAALVIDDFSIDAPKAAAVRLRGEFGGVDKAAFTGTQQQRAAAAINANMSMLELRVVNAGAFEKTIDYLAKEQKKAPDQLIAEFKAAAGFMLPGLVAGDPIGAKAAEAVSSFLSNPRSLTVSVKSKEGPLKFADVAGMSNPAALLQKLDVGFFTEGGAAPAKPAGAPQQVAQAPAQPTKLKGMAAWNALVGNTIAGKDSDGEPLYEYYMPDGRLKQLDDDELTAGKWALRGQKVCILYAGEKEESCYDVEVFGDVATFTDEDGSGTRYKILPGNPKGL